MSLKGPILLIEDDPDDQELTKSAIDATNIENEVLVFNNGQEVIDYLQETKEMPFLILCDINMPVMNGLELRTFINDSEFLKKKSIPFVFLTTAVSKSDVNLAYDLTVQGFYQKADTYDGLLEQIRLIVDYWKHCLHPNRFIL